MKRSIAYLALFLVGTLSCKKDSKNPGTDEIAVSPNDFLSSSAYKKLTIQIQFVSGFQPDANSISHLKTFLEQRLNKPYGIEFVYKSMPSPGKSAITLNDVSSLERSNRLVHHDGSDITAYICFIDGDYSQNSGSSKVLGIAYGPSSMVIFEKTIRDLSGGVLQPSVMTVETAVSEHEFGHILGLVNNGTALTINHQDVPHGKHCNNTNCLMYYASENSDLIANLTGNNIPTLDANCLNDLKGNGGK
jgi:hypothetical protein